MDAKKCTNCGVTIPVISQVCVWAGKMVCQSCKIKLRASHYDKVRFLFYVICFSLSPAAIIGFLENKYHIFFRSSIDGEPFIVFGFVALFLFGVVYLVWRTANKSKEK